MATQVTYTLSLHDALPICLKYREVAEILNISVKTVENQLAIALHKIGTAVHFDIQKTIPSSHRHPH